MGLAEKPTPYCCAETWFQTWPRLVMHPMAVLLPDCSTQRCLLRFLGFQEYVGLSFAVATYDGGRPWNRTREQKRQNRRAHAVVSAG